MTNKATEEQKSIIRKIKKGINENNFDTLLEGFKDAIEKHENVILKNALDKHFIDYTITAQEKPFPFETQFVVDLIKTASKNGNYEAIGIIPTNKYEVIQEAAKVVIANDDVASFDALSEKNDDFSIDGDLIHRIAINNNSQNMIDNISKSYFSEEVYVDILNSKNTETISKYMLKDYKEFVEILSLEEDDCLEPFLKIKDTLFKSKAFNEIATERGIDTKDVIEYSEDLLEKYHKEEYSKYKKIERTKQNIMFF
ncbi:hypothetical protein H5203_21310 [Pseudoalteromonas sp. SG41-1]|uniref:hypothetical protein n=1 Tax=Pseudoalteromonas sp. SG41-1 TaxID=2760979 RepID=UPI0016041777|nr:hypothetical protein [Pseudoalteromonas sp. SG41-1]MBB1507985.1 hypothetical protein [Pseudoalteromonas sp. SG41-1]